MIPRPPRVAFFTDCFHEVNGVALTSRQLDAYARRREYPFFSLHAGLETRVSTEGHITTVELRRGPMRLALDADMFFDLAFLRHHNLARRALLAFRPDMVHVTSPGDCGILGAILAEELKVPLVASWHTNLHEFAARRVDKVLHFLPPVMRTALVTGVETSSLACTVLFYRLARLLFAPNPELLAMLIRRTGRPAFLMRRGIETALFHPAKRNRVDRELVLGYTGRLSPEKNVRFLAQLEQGLIAAGVQAYRFLIVGQGSEQEWLQRHLGRVHFTGVLHGEELARAYADMDLFVFPSHTDTFGNVVQEALSSGVPAIVTNSGGPKYIVQDGVTGLVAKDEAGFIQAVRRLMWDHGMRRRMSTAARNYALSASWDAVFDSVYSAYDHCLGLGFGPIVTPAAPRNDAARERAMNY